MVKNKTYLSRADYISIALLFALSFFLFADQNLMGPNLTQIATDFGFNVIERDVKLGGEISLVFWLIGGVYKKGDKFILKKKYFKNIRAFIYGKNKKYFNKSLKGKVKKLGFGISKLF